MMEEERHTSPFLPLLPHQASQKTENFLPELIQVF